jgi:hypothetical protein
LKSTALGDTDFLINYSNTLSQSSLPNDIDFEDTLIQVYNANLLFFSF